MILFTFGRLISGLHSAVKISISYISDNPRMIFSKTMPGAVPPTFIVTINIFIGLLFSPIDNFKF